ncbi:MAG TPA: transporter substrate-binding protein [Nocardioides sp.]|uniref:urea ABC transporter substrate-binding protein n=1 Tax=uncultured Nocardioides sp. TaxID=198441 RepID=UPI00262A286B|nr:ABC transporter substrate-binding protein [uncultured Nocardioides sp.]HRI95004.1 transporter substrate-binding protein [Nocardioides sp.]HRK44272.1 transporter substrate-binding protein [Nocardioides sp.]
MKRHRAYWLAVLPLLATAACAGSSGGAESDTIVVGSLFDETGPLNIYGSSMADAAKLAVKSINEDGGVLGKQLELKSYDTQSDVAKYTQYANTLTTSDNVDVVVGGIVSASREAIRPVLDRAETLYFFPEMYEGGVCDKNTFVTGASTSQELEPLIPYAVENFGPRLYSVAADYNYGQISADWVDKYAADAGAEVLGKKFVPLDSSDFGAIISDIQRTQPDFVVSMLVGANHLAFYRAFAAAGMADHIKIVSPVFGVGSEHVVLAPEETEGIVAFLPYVESLDNPANADFLKAWKDEYGDDAEPVTDSTIYVWNAWHLWAAAVEKAGSIDRDKVIEALESGVSFDSPSGSVSIDPGSHHTIQDVHITVGNTSHGFDVIDQIDQAPPAFEQSVCDLVANPDVNEQFLP